MKRKGIFLSIIVCSKNNRVQLERTLSSLSPIKDFEIIAVLNGYDSKTVKALKNFFNSVTFIIDESNGLYNAMNQGAKVSSGNYLMFLNAGDELYSQQSLKILVEEAVKRNSKWAFGQIMMMKKNGKFRLTNLKNYSPFLHKFSVQFVPHPACIFQNELFSSFGGYDSNYEIIADQKLCLQFSRIELPLVSNELISLFNLGGASSRSNIEIVKDFRILSQEFHNQILTRFFSNIIFIFVYLLRVLKHRKI